MPNFMLKHNVSCFLLAFALVFCSQLSSAQYEANPLSNTRWATFAIGATTADNVSWTASGSYSHRSDVLLSQIRGAYTQEMISSAGDSCTSRMSKMGEVGMMWGDGYAGKKFYFTLAAGMGVVVRRYCQKYLYEEEAYLTGITIGVPAQLEMGVSLSPMIWFNLNVNANWNFREPYAGALLGVSYRFKKAKTTSNE
jgi:hypothetical protein